MDINPEEILTIGQSVPVHNNLQIIQVTGLGQVSKNRTINCQSRVDALRQEFLVRHPDIKFIDFVKCCQNSDGGWFRDSRGSNEFTCVSTLATFGIPYQNIGYLEMLFLTLNKNIGYEGDRGTAGKNGDSKAVASHRALKGFYKQSSRPHDRVPGLPTVLPIFLSPNW